LQLVTARPGPRGELSGAFFFSKLKEEHGKITAKWKEWDATTKAEYFDLVGGTGCGG